MSARCRPERLTAYVLGELSPPERSDVEAHLAACGACRSDVDTLAEAWERLGDGPADVRSARARRGVDRMIRTAGAGRGPRRRRSLGSFGLLRVAAGLFAALGLGYVSGRTFPGDRTSDELLQRIDRVEGALLSARLQSSSAIDRLAAIEADVTGATRPVVVEALLGTLENDPSVNVRLAAVRALGPVMADSAVALRAARAVNSDASALVQLALIERLMGLSDADVRRAALGVMDPALLAPDSRERLEELRKART